MQSGLEIVHDRQLRELIEAFIINKGLIYPWQVQSLCYEASFELTTFLAKSSLDGRNMWMPLARDIDDKMIDPTPETFGYTDRLNMGHLSHYWACVQINEVIYGIDLTSSQYGYQRPCIRKCSTSNVQVWAQRSILQAQLPPALKWQEIFTNRQKMQCAPFACFSK